MLDIAIATRSERGKRENNEDDLSAGRVGSGWYAVLADGAGGHAHGAEASQIAVDCVEEVMHREEPQFSPEHLHHTVLAAHAEVQRRQLPGDGASRMHSTIVVLWVDGASDRALWSHVGDSRLYRLRNGVIDLVTSDDSVVQRMVDAGLLTARQAQHHPKKNQLIAALGIQDAVEPHTLVQPVPIEEGDAFLLCSDGWWDSLEESVIADTLSDASSPDEWLTAMQRHIEAQDHPKQDNFSAVAVWVGDPGATTRIMGDVTLP
jgi:serine/threonine protein phosphatase PrpC